MSVYSPGATNDIVAFKNSKLDIEIHNLPPRCFIIGVNEYICDEKYLTPLSGTQLSQKKGS